MTDILAAQKDINADENCKSDFSGKLLLLSSY